MQLEKNDALVDLLVATDAEVGKSKLLVLTEKTENACVALVDRLCAKNDRIRRAVVCPEMFAALAKPGSFLAAHRLISEKGLTVSRDMVDRLRKGTSVEYMLNPTKCHL